MRLKNALRGLAIALLVVTALGASTHHVQAQGPDAGQGVKGPANDNGNEQIDEQSGPDTEEVGQATDSRQGQIDTLDGTDTDTEINDGGGDGQGDGQDAAPSGTPAISAETAQQTAEAFQHSGKADKVELDDENGQLVYSVALGSTDVKVDAMTGKVVIVESNQD